MQVEMEDSAMLHKCWATLKLDNPESATWAEFLERLEELRMKNENYASTSMALESDLEQKNEDLEKLKGKLETVEAQQQKLMAQAELMKEELNKAIDQSGVEELEAEVAKQEKIITDLIAVCVDAEEAERNYKKLLQREMEKTEEYESRQQSLDAVSQQLEMLANDLISSFEASIELRKTTNEYEDLPEVGSEIPTTVEQAEEMLFAMRQMTTKKGGAIFFSKNDSVYTLLASSVRYTQQTTESSHAQFLHLEERPDDGIID